jgi:hypothetical protein
MTYTLQSADAGDTITVTVTATNATGNANATSAATSAISAAGAAPSNAAAPTISGTTTVGDVLTASNGTWTNSPTSYTYQWNRSGAAISGATAITYTLQAADASDTITVTVTATNTTGSTAAISAATAAISAAAAAPSNTTAPTISGTTTVGDVLTASNGTWTNSPTSYTYVWKRNGTAISGATAMTYTLQSADAGDTITVTVTATNATGNANATSAATSAIASSAGTATMTLTPSSGSHGTGTTLTVTIYENSGTTAVNAVEADLTYDASELQYVSIDGSSSAFTEAIVNSGGSGSVSVQRGTTGTLTGSQIVASVSFTVLTTASNSAITFANSTAIVNSTTNNNIWNGTTAGGTYTLTGTVPVDSALPTITGTAQSGDVLTASTGTWTNTPTSYTYQWYRSGTSIPGATNSTYTLQTADIGDTMTVSVTALNGSGSGSAATSAATTAVAAANGNTATLTLTPANGTYAIGNTLSVTVYENSGSNTVNAIESDLTYDDTILEYSSVSNTTSAFSEAISTSGGSGTVSIARGTTGALTGSQIVVVVNFTVLATTNSTAITFANTSGIVSSTSNTNLWNGAPGGGTYTT